MKTSIKSLAVIGASVLAMSGSIQANANATEALKGCKAVISEDSRMAGQRVNARMDSMQSRGRYVKFTIDVRTTDADGAKGEWLATCKARGTGKVESLELAQVSANGKMVVAEN